MLFISSKKLFSFSRYLSVCIFFPFLNTLSTNKRINESEIIYDVINVSGIIYDVINWLA